MSHRTILLAFFLTGGPLVPAPIPPVNSSRQQVGAVVAQDDSLQVILIRRDYDGQLESVPFARWTEFSKTRAGSLQPGSEMEPDDLRIGDRVRIEIDPSGAVARSILVLAPRPMNYAAAGFGTQRTGLLRRIAQRRARAPVEPSSRPARPHEAESHGEE